MALSVATVGGRTATDTASDTHSCVAFLKSARIVSILDSSLSPPFVCHFLPLVAVVSGTSANRIFRARGGKRKYRKYFGGHPPYRFTPCARKYTAVKRDWLVERRIKALISGMSQSKRDGFDLCCQLASSAPGTTWIPYFSNDQIRADIACIVL